MIYWLNSVWEEVLANTSFMCWKKLLPGKYYEKEVTGESDRTEREVMMAQVLRKVQQNEGFESVDA